MANQVNRARSTSRYRDIVNSTDDIPGGGEVLPAKQGNQEVDVDSNGDELGVDKGDVDPGLHQQRSILGTDVLKIALQLFIQKV